jgi:predicted aminopeptidase
MGLLREKLHRYPLVLTALATVLTACAGPSYYAQAISGHCELLRRQQEIEPLLERSDTDPALARELRLALEMRRFAIEELGLPESDSYTRYVATGREAVTWNVVAAPEFSLQAKKWCFPVSGCVPYRGYFEKHEAERFAQKMNTKGYDVSVSPVAAYSTLGWFEDPLPDTLLEFTEEQTAAFLFHELAHQRLYVRSDAAFNEAYASFVEEKGVELWLGSTGRSERLPDWRQQQTATLQFNALLQESRDALSKAYRSQREDNEMRKAKAAIFQQLTDSYEDLVQREWRGRDRFSTWFDEGPNNARLALLATYHGGACAFEKLFRRADGDLERFHALAAQKAKLKNQERRAWLEQPCEVIAPDPDL